MALHCECANTGPGSHRCIGLGVPLAAILPPLPWGGAQKGAFSIHAFPVILRQVATLGEIPVQRTRAITIIYFRCLICCSDSPAKSELVTQITGKERDSERQVCWPRSHSQQGARSGSEPGLCAPKPEPLTAGCRGATSLVSICPGRGRGVSPGLAVTLPSPAPPPPLLLSSPDTNQASQTILFPAGRLAASFAPDGTFLACAFRHLLCLQRGLESRLGSGRNHAEDPQRYQPPSCGRDHHCVGAPGPPQGHMPSQPFPCLQTPEQWASGQSTSLPLRAQGVLVGGVRTDTISVCPQQEVDTRTWPDLTGTSTTRAGSRHGGGEEHSGWGTRGGALAGPGSSVATPPPAGEGRVNPVGKGSAEPLFVHPTNRERMGCILPHRGPPQTSLSPAKSAFPSLPLESPLRTNRPAEL